MDDGIRELLDITRQLSAHLEYQRSLGVRAIEMPLPAPAAPVKARPLAAPPAPVSVVLTVVRHGGSSGLLFLAAGDPAETLSGAAGDLFAKILESGMRLRQDDVCFCTVPAGGAVPAAELAALAPKVIVALGEAAAKALLGTKESIDALRGSWREVRGIPVMAIYHPAHLVARPGDKQKAWDDIRSIMKKLGIPIAKP